MGKKLTLEWFQDAARRRGGQCLATRYDGAPQVMEWRCADGHQWPASAASIRYAKSWCPFCAGQRVTLEDMRQLALERGGEVLSKEYENNRSSMEFRCRHGHRFEARVNDVRNGHWCNQCAGGVGERLCRLTFEALFGVVFPKVRPVWLVGPNGRRLELDGFAEGLSLAFEHQGRQHDHREAFFGKTPLERLAQSKRDQAKRRICAERGVVLIEVPEVPGRLHPDRLLEFVASACRERKVQPPDDDRVLQIDYAGAYSPGEEAVLAELTTLADRKGGVLLSTSYLGGQVHHLWRCADGHPFKAKPSNVRRGAWCGPCRRTVRHTPQRLTQMAAELGGVLVGGEYENRHSPMRWRCVAGHEFDRSVAHLAMGRWCSRCAKMDGDPEKQVAALHSLQEIARARGGQCLATSYGGVAVKVQWQCELGHLWWAVPNNVKRGSWCPTCSYVERGRMAAERAKGRRPGPVARATSSQLSRSK